jgi:predicted aspartyl protease
MLESPAFMRGECQFTIITQKMANALKVQVIGKIPFIVANNQKVEWAIGKVNSVEVGGAKVDNVLVGIAPERTTGLLGQTFLGKCDYKVEGDLLKCSRKWTPEG